MLDTFPDPAPSQDTDASPAVVLSCTPHLPKSTSPTGKRIVTSRHEASKTLIRWRSLSHIPRTLRHKRHKSSKKGRDAQANRRGCLHAYEETSQLSRDKKRFHICDHFGGEYCIGIRISPNDSVHAKHILCLAEALASPARAGNAVIYFRVRSEFGIPDVVH